MSEAIRLSDHAIDRYQERVKPGLDRAAAEADLHRMLALATIVTDPPSWVSDEAGSDEVIGYAVLTEGIVLPIVRSWNRAGTESALLAVSCVTAWCYSEATRERLNERKAKRRADARRRRESAARRDRSGKVKARADAA